MKRLFLALLLLPIFGIGQKITRIVNPEDHSLWLMTDDANLKTGVGPGQIGVHFRVEGPSVYLYIWGNSGEVGERDWAAFIKCAVKPIHCEHGWDVRHKDFKFVIKYIGG